MPNVLVNDDSLKAIGNAIRGKNGETTTYKPAEMAAAITAISGGDGLTQEDLTFTNEQLSYIITPNTNYLQKYYDKMKFVPNTISNTTFLDFGQFAQDRAASDLSKIIIDCNGINIFYGQYMFSITNVQKLPKIINASDNLVLGTTYMFVNGNNNLTENEILRFISNFSSLSNYIHRGTSTTTCYPFIFNGSFDNVLDFSQCILKNNEIKHNEYSYKKFEYYDGLQSFYASYIKSLNNIYLPYDQTKLNITDNKNLVPQYLYCVNSITFETDNGTPYTVRMKNQTIELQTEGYYNYGYNNNFKKAAQGYWKEENNVGYNATTLEQLKQNYSALKNREDWFIATNVRENNIYCAIYFSRYNHDSAVETINSLPDTSAYLATAGGTNTIKFRGEAGKYTDGGAINTLTEEEIAVATAKGWTVSFV